MCSDCCWTSASTVRFELHHKVSIAENFTVSTVFRSFPCCRWQVFLLLFVLWSFNERKTGKILVNEQRIEYWEWKFKLTQCSTKLSVFGRVIVFLNRSSKFFTECTMKIYVIPGWQHNCEAEERKKNLTELPLSARFPFHCHCDGCRGFCFGVEWFKRPIVNAWSSITNRKVLWVINRSFFNFSCCRCGDSSLQNRKSGNKHAKCCFWKVNRQNKEINAGMVRSD